MHIRLVDPSPGGPGERSGLDRVRRTGRAGVRGATGPRFGGDGRLDLPLAWHLPKGFRRQMLIRHRQPGRQRSQESAGRLTPGGNEETIMAKTRSAGPGGVTGSTGHGDGRGAERDLAIDATAALWSIDFASGETLHLSGSAAIEWSPQDRREMTTAPGRGVRLTVSDATPLQPSRKSDLGASAVPLVGVRYDMYGRLFR
jgi:hypothetical protein